MIQFKPDMLSNWKNQIQKLIKPEAASLNPQPVAPPPETRQSPKDQNQIQVRAEHAKAPNQVNFPNPSGALIDQSYEGARPTPSETPFPRTQDMTPAQRLQALNTLSQVDSLEATRSDEDRCGATSLTAAAIYANGERGLASLISATQAFNQSPPLNGAVDLGGLGDIQNRLNSGAPLTHGDISRIEDGLYSVIHRYKGEIGRGQDSGLTNRVINAFLDAPGTRELRTLMDQNDIGLRHIDNQGRGEARHFVMMVPANGTRAVYDPYPRRDGQVIQDPQMVQHYLNAVHHHSGRTFR